MRKNNGHLLAIINLRAPSYADFANYLANGVLAHDVSYQQKRFFANVKYYFWYKPLLLKRCIDGVIRRCLPKNEVHSITFQCHVSPFGDHDSTSKTAAKVLQSGFIGLVFSRMFTDMLSIVMLVNVLEIFQGEMICLSAISLK